MALREYHDLVGFDWLWQSVDGAMTVRLTPHTLHLTPYTYSTPNRPAGVTSCPPAVPMRPLGKNRGSMLKLKLTLSRPLVDVHADLHQCRFTDACEREGLSDATDLAEVPSRATSSDPLVVQAVVSCNHSARCY